MHRQVRQQRVGLCICAASALRRPAGDPSSQGLMNCRIGPQQQSQLWGVNSF
jgi:hypothetical protein